MAMSETFMTFGPEWLRRLARGSNPPAHYSPKRKPLSRPSLAKFRYGREDMLALFPKDLKQPECLKEFPQLSEKDYQMPLALIPITEDEQRLWARSVNSDAALRASGKTAPNNLRNIRGGSVDRGRGRGRGHFYRGAYDEIEDGLHNNFSRKPVDRSQSVSDKDHHWEDRDRRYDRQYTGSRLSWRNNMEKENRSTYMNDITRNVAHHPPVKPTEHAWDDQVEGNGVPEWSLDKPSETGVGSFDSSGAFFEAEEAKKSESISSSDDGAEPFSNNKLEKHKSNNIKHIKNTALSNQSPDHQDHLPEKAEKHPVHSARATSQRTESVNTGEILKVTQQGVYSNNESVCNRIPLSNVFTESNKSDSTVGNFQESFSTMIEEDTFAHHKKATENMVAQWEEEEKVSQYFTTKIFKDEVSKLCDEKKWFIKDLQGASKGPFSSPDMQTLYKQRSLDLTSLIRRECDERFCTLAEIVDFWGAVPFELEFKPPPIRVIPRSTPIPPPVPYAQPSPSPSPSSSSPMHIANSENCLVVLQPQYVPQHLLQQRIMIPQAAVQQFIPAPRELENFTNCNPQQQIFLPQIIPNPARQNVNPMGDQAAVESVDYALPVVNFTPAPPMLKKDMNVWDVSQRPATGWPTALHPPTNNNMWEEQRNNLEPKEMEMENNQSIEDKPLIKTSSEEKEHEIVAEVVKENSCNEFELQESEKMKQGIQILNEEEVKPEQLVDDQDHSEELRKQEVLKRMEQNILDGLKINEELNMEKRKSLESKKNPFNSDRHEKNHFKQEAKVKDINAQELRKERISAQTEIHISEEICDYVENEIEQELAKQEEISMQDEHFQQDEVEHHQPRQNIKNDTCSDKTWQEETQRQDEPQKEEVSKHDKIQQKNGPSRQHPGKCEIARTHKKKKESSKSKKQQKKEQVVNDPNGEEEPSKGVQNHFEEKQEEQKQEIDKEQEPSSNQKETLLLEKVPSEVIHYKLEPQDDAVRKVPVWHIPEVKTPSDVSLSEIQKSEEARAREEREERLAQRLLHAKQVQDSKPTWAKRPPAVNIAVKSLSEIQQEEAERVAHEEEERKLRHVAMLEDLGLWSNSSRVNQLYSKLASDGYSNPYTRSGEKSTKSNPSAFPVLNDPVQPAIINNKNKTSRVRKEKAAAKLLGAQCKSTDELTMWCTQALSTLQSAIDTPTLIAFLREVESPHEVYDYVKSYIGEGQEPEEFARQFLEKRSKLQNDTKPNKKEEKANCSAQSNTTPCVNKVPPVANVYEGNANTKGKIKKKKGRMQKLDSSLLGFTVHANPDRLNVGEICHIEGM